jgi:hypothetical protein
MTGRRGAQLPDAQPAATVFSVRVLRLLELRPHADGPPVVYVIGPTSLL